MVVMQIWEYFPYSIIFICISYDGIKPLSTVYNLGIAKSFPLGFTIFVTFFSLIFHSLTVLSFVVTMYIFLPYPLNHWIWLIFSSISVLFRKSNSLVWLYNSVRYLKFEIFDTNILFFLSFSKQGPQKQSIYQHDLPILGVVQISQIRLQKWCPHH